MFGRSAAGSAGAASWDDASARRDEARVRRGFWPKLKRVAAKLPFAEDLLSAYYAAFDRQTPLQVKAALLGALAYFVLPADAMPDILPLLGYTDDALVLVTALRMVTGHIRDEHREAARQALAREFSAAR
ncbi:MAG: DUF1232 domain-containing protein [Xanthobacteraceae bacterium]|nr:DUF1232 domain-containing protein [Xanthobacteraceae bacterium]